MHILGDLSRDMDKSRDMLGDIFRPLRAQCCGCTARAMLLANVPSVNGSIEKHGQEHFYIYFEDENVPGHVASVKGSAE